jgi:hypothetical protein
MNWLLEPRSKGYEYYDDAESVTLGKGSNFDWKCIFYLPLFFLILVLISVAPLIMLILYFLNDVFQTLIRTFQSGKLAYPFFFIIGWFFAAYLVIPLLSIPIPVPLPSTLVLYVATPYIFLFTFLPFLALCAHGCVKTHSFLTSKFGKFYTIGIEAALLVIIASSVFIFWVTPLITSPSLPSTNQVQRPFDDPLIFDPKNPEIKTRSIKILVDDFSPQPYQGESNYFFNRIGGDRGALNNSFLSWGDGQVSISIPYGNSWGGVWMSLNHPIREHQAIDFSAILPPQILPSFQSKITGITVTVYGTPSRILRTELKDTKNDLKWLHEDRLSGDRQTIYSDLPPLKNISQLVLVLDNASPGDSLVIDEISLIASTSITDTPTAAFVWSYGMLLNNWNPASGLVRDKATDASGEFDAVQATGSLAAATAIAEQLGVINYQDSVAIVNKISDTLMNRIPRNHGLWPHWVRASSDGKFEIVPDTEWSSVDTVIAAIGLLDARSGLNLDTTSIEQILREVDWNNLLTLKGISHGYTYDDQLIPYAWDVFGGESWLVELAYASATGKVATLMFPSPPTSNGAGFIDELSWLFTKPPSNVDYWGTDWTIYRSNQSKNQLTYYSARNPNRCYSQIGLFGLSPSEVPQPERVPKKNIYQAFGIGGQFSYANDGSSWLGTPVIVPHYSALIASIEPEKSIKMWNWLISEDYFSPLNNVESLTLSDSQDCRPVNKQWNQLKGSWNLSLQTLGWGRYLAERNGNIPILWQATLNNQFLQSGFLLLSPLEHSIPESGPTLETPSASILENAQGSCDGKPLEQWSLPGKYLFKQTNEQGVDEYHTLELIQIKDCIKNTRCPIRQWRGNQKFENSSWGNFFLSPVVNGFAINWDNNCSIGPSVCRGTVSTQNIELISTKLGRFEAVRLDAEQEYHLFYTHRETNGLVEVSRWYVCGLGLVRVTMDQKGDFQYSSFNHHDVLELIKYSPPQ